MNGANGPNLEAMEEKNTQFEEVSKNNYQDIQNISWYWAPVIWPAYYLKTRNLITSLNGIEDFLLQRLEFEMNH
jgi:hypothetical protein